MEAVRNLNHRRERIGQSEGTDAIRGHQNSEAVGLQTPEFVIIGQIVEMLHQRGQPTFVKPCGLKLVLSLLSQVAKFNATSIGLLGLIEEVRLVPENGTLKIELFGQLAALINLTNKNPRSKETGAQVTLVAGVGFEPTTFRL